VVSLFKTTIRLAELGLQSTEHESGPESLARQITDRSNTPRAQRRPSDEEEAAEWLWDEKGMVDDVEESARGVAAVLLTSRLNEVRQATSQQSTLAMPAQSDIERALAPTNQSWQGTVGGIVHL
jgi:hypothetical protein